MRTEKNISALILGIGNILWADEGFGVRAAELFARTFFIKDPLAEICEGGTLGMALFDRICRTKNLFIFDCCDFKAPAGELRVLRGNEIRIWTATKLSPHQTSMNDLLAAAALCDSSPEFIAVIGIQPLELDDYGGSLSPLIEAKLPQAVQEAARLLRERNIAVRTRSAATLATLLNAECLSYENYPFGGPPCVSASR